MNSASSPDGNSEPIRLFMRHVVPILLEFERGQETHSRMFTTFAMEIRGNFVLVTAGHVLQDVRENEAKGYRVARARLLDGLGTSAQFRHAAPLDWDATQKAVPFRDHHNDFGLIFIDGMARAMLELNGVVPIDERAWDAEPTRADFYILVGAPSELSTPGFPLTKVASVVLTLDRLSEPPPELCETVAHRWYGRIRSLDPGFADIDGMSGGPIFALHHDGVEWRYWLQAVQSAWHRPTRTVAACPTRQLGNLLAEIAQGGAAASSVARTVG
jgi:hypothetical protein